MKIGRRNSGGLRVMRRAMLALAKNLTTFDDLDFNRVTVGLE